LYEVVPPTPNAHSTNVTTTTHRRPLVHNRMGTFFTFIVLYGLNHISVYIYVGLISMTRPERRSYILCDNETHIWILQYWTDYVYLCMVVIVLSVFVTILIYWCVYSFVLIVLLVILFFFFFSIYLNSFSDDQCWMAGTVVQW
jgi:hypothetical protein